MADDKPNDGVTPENQNQKPDENQDDDESKGLPENVKEILRKNRKDAKDAKDAARIASEKADTLQKQIDDAAKAKAKDDEDAAAKRGEFKELAEQRKTELDAATADKQALADRVAAYEARDRKRIDDGLADVPDAFKVFDPGPDAPLESRLAWFEKAMAQADAQTKDVKVPGVTPRPNGGGKNPEIKSLVHASSA